MEEDGVAIDENEERRPAHTPIGHIRLPSVMVHIFGQIETLSFHASA